MAHVNTSSQLSREKQVATDCGLVFSGGLLRRLAGHPTVLSVSPPSNVRARRSASRPPSSCNICRCICRGVNLLDGRGKPATGWPTRHADDSRVWYESQVGDRGASPEIACHARSTTSVDRWILLSGSHHAPPLDNAQSGSRQRYRAPSLANNGNPRVDVLFLSQSAPVSRAWSVRSTHSLQ